MFSIDFPTTFEKRREGKTWIDERNKTHANGCKDQTDECGPISDPSPLVGLLPLTRPCPTGS
jgi:hypothetical protein